MSAGQQQALGAGATGLLAGGLCALAGGNPGTCAAIGVAGAAAGWAVTAQYQATQVRSAQDDQRLYGLTAPVSNTQVKIRKGTSMPATVRPGSTVKLVTDYSLMTPRAMPGADVQESWVLKKDGKVLANVPPKLTHRPAGGWAADASIPIPQNAQPGTYVVEHKVQAGGSYDTDESVFVVGS
jgi:hypothetical protein